MFRSAALALLLSAPAFCSETRSARAPMTPARLGEIQALLETPKGLKLAEVEPSLGAIRDLSARSDLHLTALGGLAAQLDAGKPVTAGSLLSAAQAPEHAAQVASALDSQVARLRAAASMTAGEKTAAAKQLSTAADLAESFEDKRLAKTAKDARALAAALDPSAAPATAGRVKWIDVLDLRPTQFDVGMQQVEKKKKMLLEMTPGQRRAWLLAHPVPVVVRKNGESRVQKKGAARPNDHHHETRAAWEAGITRVPVVVTKLDSGKTDKKFWKKMRKQGNVWLKDRWGNEHDEADLPMDVRGLGDNPYRSIAGEVRDRGGYEKTRAPFAEFLWADYFRRNLSIHPNDDFKGAVKEALKLARDKRARKLPGYKGK